MGQGEDDMIMVTRQEPRPLRTGAVAARIVPDTGDVAIRARLDMTAQGGCPALHEGMRSAAHVGRQGMALLIGGKGVLEDRLERDERHRCLRTPSRRRSSGGFLQYHANYPRCKRLVQSLFPVSVPRFCLSTRGRVVPYKDRKALLSESVAS